MLLQHLVFEKIFPYVFHCQNLTHPLPLLLVTPTHPKLESTIPIDASNKWQLFLLFSRNVWKNQQIFNNSKLFSLWRRWGLHLHKLKSFSTNIVQFSWKSGSKEEDEIVKSLRPRPLERRWIDITRDTGNLFATFSIIVISASNFIFG